MKTYSIIIKLVLYLILWFHTIACGWWIVLGWNAGLEFYKRIDGLRDGEYAG